MFPLVFSVFILIFFIFSVIACDDDFPGYLSPLQIPILSKRVSHVDTTSTTMTDIKFSSFSSQVDPSFWFTLSTLKLNTWKLDSSPRQTTAFYSTPLRPLPNADSTLKLASSAFDPELSSPPPQPLSYACVLTFSG